MNTISIQAKGGNTPRTPKPEITPPPQKKSRTGKVTQTKKRKPRIKVAVNSQQ